MYSIIIIIPYFGKFNQSNTFWLKSVEKNQTVDFLLVTDQQIDVPTNVHTLQMSFDECVLRFQKMLDCNISALHPYKLCDFKPAYGYLFQEYITKYDFWGHCDNDLILGDIRCFITDNILQNYDRILSRGHFTLYRNSTEINEVFKKTSPSYKIVFSSELIFHFDEHPGTGRYWFENMGNRIYDEIIFDDLDWHCYRFVDVHKAHTLDKNRSNFIYSYENGKLFRCFLEQEEVKREEIMYVHFQKRNMKVRAQVTDYFTIIPNKFIPYQSHLDNNFLKKYTRNNYLYAPFHFIQVKWKSLKRKIDLWKRHLL